MNTILYISTALTAIYCINTAITMSLKTNAVYVLSILLFFGASVGGAIYAHFFGVTTIHVLLMISICGILFSNRRKR